MAIHPTDPPAAPQIDLAKLREKQGISLDQIAESTKISMRFLRAIEAAEFEKLPGGIFTRSYIRQYAVAIGYDEDALLEIYRTAMGLDEAPAPKSAAAASGNGSGVKWQRSPVAL